MFFLQPYQNKKAKINYQSISQHCCLFTYFIFPSSEIIDILSLVAPKVKYVICKQSEYELNLGERPQL